jgi:RNA polymerase sigma factor (sigma-70 family)
MIKEWLPMPRGRLLTKWGIEKKKPKDYIRTKEHKELLAEEEANVQGVAQEEQRRYRRTRHRPLRSLAARFLDRLLDQGPQPVVVLEREAALKGVRPINELHKAKAVMGVVEFWIGGTLYWAHQWDSISDQDAIAQGQAIALLPWTRPEMFGPWGNNENALWSVFGGGKAHGTAEEAEQAEAYAYPGRSADSPCRTFCPKCPDEELIRRHLNPDLGDEDRRCALDQLVSRYRPLAFQRARQLLQNIDDAKDAVQQAFLKVQEGLPGFRGGSSFKTWMMRIVQNAAYDLGRYRSRPLRKTQLIKQTLTGNGDWAMAYAEGTVLPGEFPSEQYDPRFPHAQSRQWPTAEDVEEFKNQHKRPRSVPRNAA